MLSIRVSARADRSREAVVLWYEAKRLGLGLEFDHAFEELLESIRRSPKLGRPYDGDEVRKCTLPRPWPYYVIYKIREQDIVVLVIHGSRQDEPQL
jgi:plasmid stabilization system protein ParE